MKKLVLWFLVIIVGIPIGVMLIGGIGFLLANRTNGALVSGGERRTYYLHIPEGYDPAVPVPLVISIHGFAEWPAHQMRISHWNDLADEAGFLVVYPSGTSFPLRWRITQAGGTPESDYPDVEFISDLIVHLESQYAIDPARIYVNGLSNGGGMSFLLSCKLSERIAAFGSVSGAYLTPWSDCFPARPVPAIIFHGTQDPIVPYLGGPSRSFDQPFPSIPNWVDMLAERYGCESTPLTLPPVGDVSGVRYVGCHQQAEILFYTIAGGGHSWPGGEKLPEVIVGSTTMDVDATRLMWEFFEQHPLQNY